MENRFLGGIILIAGFVMAVSAASMYAQSQIISGHVCGCAFPLEALIPLFSSAGLLIGSLAYYFMSSHLKSKEKKDLMPILSILDYDQRRVIEELIKHGCSMPQSRIVAATGLNKVKVSRLVSALESKGVVKKETSGVTNMVELDENLRGIFC